MKFGLLPLIFLLSITDSSPVGGRHHNRKHDLKAKQEVRSIVSAIVDAILDGDRKRRSEVVDTDDEDFSPSKTPKTANQYEGLLEKGYGALKRDTEKRTLTKREDKDDDQGLQLASVIATSVVNATDDQSDSLKEGVLQRDANETDIAYQEEPKTEKEFGSGSGGGSSLLNEKEFTNSGSGFSEDPSESGSGLPASVAKMVDEEELASSNPVSRLNKDETGMDSREESGSGSESSDDKEFENRFHANSEMESNDEPGEEYNGDQVSTSGSGSHDETDGASGSGDKDSKEPLLNDGGMIISDEKEHKNNDESPFKNVSSVGKSEKDSTKIDYELFVSKESETAQGANSVHNQNSQKALNVENNQTKSSNENLGSNNEPSASWLKDNENVLVSDVGSLEKQNESSHNVHNDSETRRNTVTRVDYYEDEEPVDQTAAQNLSTIDNKLFNTTEENLSRNIMEVNARTRSEQNFPNFLEMQSNNKQRIGEKSRDKQLSDKQSSDKPNREEKSRNKPSREKQLSDKQLSDEQPSDEQSRDKQLSDEQPSDKQSSDKQSGDEQPIDKENEEEESRNKELREKQSRDKQTSDEQSGDERSSDIQSSDRQPSDKQPSDKQPSDEQWSDKPPGDKQSSDKQPSDKQPSDKQPSDKQPSDEQPSDEHPSGKQSTDKQWNDKQWSDKQSLDKQSGDKQSSDKENREDKSRNKPWRDKQSRDKQSSDKQSSDEQSNDKQWSDKQSSGKQWGDEQTKEEQEKGLERENIILKKETDKTKGQASSDPLDVYKNRIFSSDKSNEKNILAKYADAENDEDLSNFPTEQAKASQELETKDDILGKGETTHRNNDQTFKNLHGEEMSDDISHGFVTNRDRLVTARNQVDEKSMIPQNQQIEDQENVEQQYASNIKGFENINTQPTSSYGFNQDDMANDEPDSGNVFVNDEKRRRYGSFVRDNNGMGNYQGSVNSNQFLYGYENKDRQGDIWSSSQAKRNKISRVVGSPVVNEFVENNYMPAKRYNIYGGKPLLNTQGQEEGNAMIKDQRNVAYNEQVGNDDNVWQKRSELTESPNNPLKMKGDPLSSLVDDVGEPWIKDFLTKTLEMAVNGDKNIQVPDDGATNFGKDANPSPSISNTANSNPNERPDEFQTQNIKPQGGETTKANKDEMPADATRTSDEDDDMSPDEDYHDTMNSKDDNLPVAVKPISRLELSKPLSNTTDGTNKDKPVNQPSPSQPSGMPLSEVVKLANKHSQPPTGLAPVTVGLTLVADAVPGQGSAPGTKTTPGQEPDIGPVPAPAPARGVEPGPGPHTVLLSALGPAPGPAPGSDPGPAPGPHPEPAPGQKPEHDSGPGQVPGSGPEPAPGPAPGSDPGLAPGPYPGPAPGQKLEHDSGPGQVPGSGPEPAPGPAPAPGPEPAPGSEPAREPEPAAAVRPVPTQELPLAQQPTTEPAAADGAPQKPNKPITDVPEQLPANTIKQPGNQSRDEGNKLQGDQNQQTVFLTHKEFNGNDIQRQAILNELNNDMDNGIENPSTSSKQQLDYNLKEAELIHVLKEAIPINSRRPGDIDSDLKQELEDLKDYASALADTADLSSTRHDDLAKKLAGDLLDDMKVADERRKALLEQLMAFVTSTEVATVRERLSEVKAQLLSFAATQSDDPTKIRGEVVRLLNDFMKHLPLPKTERQEIEKKLLGSKLLRKLVEEGERRALRGKLKKALVDLVADKLL